jgi:hypothetical protein
MTRSAPIIFAIGEPVPWHQAPGGIAQISDLLRCNVELLWRDERGRIRRQRVNAARLAAMASAQPFLFPIDPNPYGRGVVR